MLKVDFMKFIKPDLLSKLKTANKSYYAYNCTYLDNNFKMLVIGVTKFEIKEDENNYDNQIISYITNIYTSVYRSCDKVYRNFKK